MENVELLWWGQWWWQGWGGQLPNPKMATGSPLQSVKCLWDHDFKTIHLHFTERDWGLLSDDTRVSQVTCGKSCFSDSQTRSFFTPQTHGLSNVCLWTTIEILHNIYIFIVYEFYGEKVFSKCPLLFKQFIHSQFLNHLSNLKRPN